MGVGHTSIVDRHREETGRAIGGGIGSELFQMPADRLFPFIDAEDRLESGVCRARGRMPHVQGHGVGGLRVEPALVREVEDTSPLEPGEGLDLLEDRPPLRLAQPVEHVRRKPRDLGQLEDEEGPLLHGRRPGRLDPPSAHVAQLSQGPCESECLPGRVRQGQAVQDEPDRQEFDETSLRYGLDDAIAPDLDLPEHARPAAKRQQGGGEETFPVLLRDAEDLQRLPDRLERADLVIREPRQLLLQPAHPEVGGTVGLAIESAEGAVEPFVTSGHGPVGQPLIQETRAESAQQLMDRWIGVRAGRLEKQVTVTDGLDGTRGERGQVPHPVAADPPEGLEREPLPLAVAPELHLFIAEPVQQLAEALGHSRRSAGSGRTVPARLGKGAEVPDHPSPRLGDQTGAVGGGDLLADFAKGVGLGDIPDQLFRRTDAKGELEHRQSELETRPETGDHLVRRVAKILLQGFLQLIESDSPPRQFVAIAILAEERLTAEDVRALLDRLTEGQVFEGVERIVVNEDGDRPLGRQQVAGVLDQLLQMLQPGFGFREGRPRLLVHRGSMHVCHWTPGLSRTGCPSCLGGRSRASTAAWTKD